MIGPGAIDPEREQAIRLIEAMIFAATEPVPDEILAARLPAGLNLGPLIDALRAGYRFRGINLVRVAGGWSFRTAPDLAVALSLETEKPRKPTRAQIETLAIIAYHQPVSRAEIEEIRGVALSKGTLDTLIEAGWVQSRGRRESPGRPVLWVTTDGFLTHFGLDSLDDLPNLEELKASGLLDAGPGPSLGEGRIDPAEPEFEF